MRIQSINSWPVWTEQRRVLAIVAVVEATTLALLVANWSSFSRADIKIGLFLISLSTTYSLFVAGWEVARRHLLYQRAPTMTPNVLGTWCFGAAIMLPPFPAALATLASVLGGTRAYYSVGRNQLYRFVYSAAASVLAAMAASFAFHNDQSLGVALVLAGSAWLVTDYGLLAIAILAAGQIDDVKRMLTPRTYYLELTTMMVAVGGYLIGSVELPLIWLSLPAAVAIQRYFVNVELRAHEPAARPITSEAWLQIATVIIEASDATTVLRIDTADPQAAGMVAMMQGGCDAIGHYPDGGLAVLLLDCPPVQGDSLARRLRLALNHHKIEAYVAAASAPRDGRTLQDLLTLCEAELVLLREAARRSTSA